MKLSDFICCDLEIEQDCDFDALIKIDDRFDGRALTFVENEKYIDKVIDSKSIVGIIIAKELKGKIKNKQLGIAYSSVPKASLIRINNMMLPHFNETQFGNSCKISPSANISPDGVVIGDNVVIEDNVTIYSGTVIGSNCIIGSHSVIGSDCYERCLDENGNHVIATHKGGVIIRDNTIIEQRVIIDKALFNWDNTEIGCKCFVGRDACIAHGCKLFENVYIYHRAFLCGNVIVERNSKIGIGAIVANRVHIGENADIKLGSVVTKNVENNSAVSGNFAIPHSVLIETIKKLAKSQ